MSLSDIDDAGARQRLADIAAASRAALDARVRKAAELAEASRQAVERERADLAAALARKADVEAARAAEERAAEQEKRARKPATLSLGGEELRQQPAKPSPRRRPARPEGDDDMSGRTWLR